MLSGVRLAFLISTTANKIGGYKLCVEAQLSKCHRVYPSMWLAGLCHRHFTLSLTRLGPFPRADKMCDEMATRNIYPHQSPKLGARILLFSLLSVDHQTVANISARNH